MSDLRWYDEPAGSLTVPCLHELLALRSAVFVVEQDCAYQDIDGRDLLEGTRHVWAEDSAAMVAYARLLAPESSGSARIGRVVVAPAARGGGLGHELIERSVTACRRHWPAAGIALAAQAHLQQMYAAHGFAPVGDVYEEDGIPHVDMFRAD